MNRSSRQRAVWVLAVAAVVAGFAARLTFRSRPMDEFDLVARAEPFEREDLIREVTRACPPSRRPELLRRVAALEGGDDLALGVLHEAMEADPADADPVLRAYRERFPNSPLLAKWGFTLRLKQGRFDEAVRLYREEAARRGGSEADRRSILYQFLHSMADAGRPVEAYREADPRDAEFAFRQLAERLEEGCDRREPAAIATLRALVAAHGRAAGSTPWTLFHGGRADEAEGKDEDAQREYAEAMRRLKAAGHVPRPQFSQAAADREWDQVRNRRVFCLWRLGRWEQAYDECEPPENTFRLLSQMFEPKERVDDLRRLVERHRARCPDDPTLSYWQGVIHWNRGEYDKAVPCFADHLREAKMPHRFELTATDRSVRSLIRLGRLDDARALLNPPDRPRWPDELHWRLILAAKAGDEATLDRILGEFAAVRRDGPAEAYADPDLGPLLRSDRFAGLRAKYPPPAGGAH